jgi:hypothetical protein
MTDWAAWLVRQPLVATSLSTIIIIIIIIIATYCYYYTYHGKKIHQEALTLHSLVITAWWLAG